MKTLRAVALAIALAVLWGETSDAQFEGSPEGTAGTVVCNLSDVACGSLADGKIMVWSGGFLTAVAMSGDCTIDGTGAVTCSVGGHDLYDETTLLDDADGLAFVGSSVTCAKDVPLNRVICTFTGATQEEVEDYVGGMVSGNTETCIDVTYEDGDGTIDYIVSVSDACITSVAIGKLTGVHAGTNLAADLEEEAHTTEHQEGGADELPCNTIMGCEPEGSHAVYSGLTVGECDGTAGACGIELSCNSGALSTEDQGVCFGGTVEGDRCSENVDCSGGSICTDGDIYRIGVDCDDRPTMRTPAGALRGLALLEDLDGVVTDCPGTSEAKVHTSCQDVALQAELDAFLDDPRDLAAGSTLDGDSFCVDTGSGCGSGGAAAVIDIGDDGGSDPDLVEVATTGTDTNGVFTYVPTGKLLIDLSKDWPKADLADAATALAANPDNCATATHFATGINAAGVADCEAIADGDLPSTITRDSEVPSLETDPEYNSECGAAGVNCINVAEVVDEGVGAGMDGDTGSGVSHDDLHDWVVVGDPDYDGKPSVLDLLSCAGKVVTDASGAISCGTDDTGTDDQTAAEVPFTPAGSLAADDVAEALGELDSEKEPAGAYSGIGDCGAGNFARALNDGAAPTCAADDDNPDAVADLPACATAGHVYKSSGGVMVCAADADSANAAGEPNTFYVCWDGTDQSVASGGGTLSQPFRDVQYCINRATEQGDPSDWTCSLCAGEWNDASQTFPYRFWNTDTSSAQYGKAATGLKIRGAGERLTTIVCDFTLQTEGCANGVWDLTGAYLVVINDIATNAGIGPGQVSSGGTKSIRSVNAPISGVGWPRLRFRGIGNETNGWDYSSYFTLASTGGGSIIKETGAKPSGRGFCSKAGWRGGTCANNTDCGGVCDSGATTTAKIGDYCVVDADCGAGSPASTCDFTPTCSTQSLDHMWTYTFHQHNGANFTQVRPRTCEGGATTLTGTVTTDHDDTCSSGTCVTLGGSYTCDTNADCQRYVVGSGTNFDPEVGEGESIIVGGVERSVLRRRSDTWLEVTDEWGASSSAVAATVSNDGWPCEVSADCDTSGTCTTHNGGFLEEHLNNSELLSAGESGFCDDGAGTLDWPLEPCVESADDDATAEHYCQEPTACDQDSDCGLFEVCNNTTGFCRTNTLCEVDGDCTGTSGCTSCTCPNECGAGTCLTYGVYVEGSTSKLRLRDVTLTSTSVVGTNLDQPLNQVRAVQGGEIEVQGGSTEVEGTSAIDDEWKLLDTAKITARAILGGLYGVFRKAIRLGDGTAADFCFEIDDDEASNKLLCWDDANEAWKIDSQDATNNTVVRWVRNGTLIGTLKAWYYLGAVPLLDWQLSESDGQFRVLDESGNAILLCNASGDYCTAPSLRQNNDKLPYVRATCGEDFYIPSPTVGYHPKIWPAPENVTITSIVGAVDAGTVTFDLVNNVGGADTCINSSDADPAPCSSAITANGTPDTSFAGDATVTSGHYVGIDIISSSGAAGLSVSFQCTVD